MLSLPRIRLSSRFLRALFFSGFLLIPASAQPDGTGSRRRPPRPEPAWILPAVEAPDVRHRIFDSPAAGEKVSYLVYLPPGYDKSAGTRYPVVYWLHGIGGSQQGVPAFCDRLTRAIAAGKAPPMLVVFVNGMVDSFYCDAAGIRRPVETVIVKDLVPHIDATWRTVASREGRAVEGFSMGGFGAAHLGFKYPDLFGAVSLIDAALVNLHTVQNRHASVFARVFNSDEAVFTAEHPLSLLEKNLARIKDRTVIRQIAGPLLSSNQPLHQRLDALGVSHEFRAFDDVPHSHQVIYDRLDDDNWSFYRRAFARTAAGVRPAPAAR